MTGSHFGISTTLGSGIPSSDDFLAICIWFVIGDRRAETHPFRGGQVISYESGKRRECRSQSECHEIRTDSGKRPHINLVMFLAARQCVNDDGTVRVRTVEQFSHLRSLDNDRPSLHQ